MIMMALAMKANCDSWLVKDIEHLLAHGQPPVRMIKDEMVGPLELELWPP